MRQNLPSAFTLSEVLITLGIIGVVAALTIPQLVANYKEKQTVTKVKKAYATLENAYMLATNEYGENFRKDIDWYSANAPSEFLKKLSPFLSIRINCKDAISLCFPQLNDRNNAFYYTFLEKKGTLNVKIFKNSAVILNDGTLLVVYPSPHANYGAVEMMVDINGPAKPNHYGHDTFFFFIEDNTNNKLLGKRYWEAMSKCKKNSLYQAIACADWILKNENMDYLH